MRPRPLRDSFRNAGRGLLYALTSQRNMKIHLAAALIVIGAGFYFHIQPWEWVMLLLTIALVMSAEVINTAIECAIDLVTKEKEPLARKSKDAAAGAVLLTAGFAVIIGLIVFLPRLVNLLTLWVRG